MGQAVSTTPAIGIDLGTTYSCVAVWQNNRAEIIPDDQGNRTTPSYVAFTDTQRFIGSEAKDQADMNPTNTVYDIKRLIGQRYSDPTLQNDARFWPFKVAEGARDKPLIWQQYKGEEKQFAAEEIAAMLLVKMREIAEAHLGRPVKDAVIAVPASFTDHQREATRNACAIAGLNVMRLINEPTAAAVAYGLDNISRAERNVLVFNLGGGTFDASVLTIDKGFIQVKATAGDAQLGGEDFDNRMIAHFVGYLKQRHGKDISGNPKMMRKLKTECEKAKRFLSSANRAIIEIDNLFEGTDFSSTITRDLFEELNADLFAKCVKTVDKCLNDAKVDKRRIDQVVLVGGSTRIPRVQQLLQELFDGKELCKSVNPDEAVACGAAVQAAMLRQDGSERLQGLLLVDVASFSLGLEDGGGNMNVLIHKNSTIPAKKELVIPATFSRRPCAAIKVYEGESKKTSDNNLLGRFEISGFPAAERSVLQATVRFDVDADGILNLSITEKNIGKRMNVTRDSSRLGNDEIAEMKQRGNKYKVEDEEHRRKIEAKNELEKYVINVQYAVEEMSRAIERTTGWLEASQAAKVGEFENKMKELKAVCCNLLAKKLH